MLETQDKTTAKIRDLYFKTNNNNKNNSSRNINSRSKNLLKFSKETDMN
jgi:hypothetical protein